MLNIDQSMAIKRLGTTGTPLNIHKHTKIHIGIIENSDLLVKQESWEFPFKIRSILNGYWAESKS